MPVGFIFGNELEGVTLKEVPEQMAGAVIFAIAGLGFTVIVYGKDAPKQVEPTLVEAVATYVMVIADAVEFTRV